MGKGGTIQSQGGGLEYFEIINLEQPAWNNYFPSRTVLYKYVKKLEILSAPPSRVEINNLPPPPGDWMVTKTKQ